MTDEQASSGPGTAEYSQGGVDPAAGADRTVVFRPCRHCEVPVEQPSGRVKEFCSNAHRAAHRADEEQAAILAVQAAVEDAQAALEQVAAKLQGAMQLLARFKKRKK